MKEDGCLFHLLTENDLPEIWARQQRLHALSSEFDAFRLYAWQQWDRMEIAFWRAQFVLRFHLKGEPCYVAPYEAEDFPELLMQLMDHERAQGGRQLLFMKVENDTLPFPETFTASPRREYYDYLYDAQALIHMQGRSYAAKRNQISQFKRKYPWRFEPLTPENGDACLQVLNAWDHVHQGASVDAERVAIKRMLSLREDYGQCGGVLFANETPVAFSIGSHSRPALLDIIAEKALPEYIGAYSMIIQSFAAYAYERAPFTYINREEDMGLENLRNATLQLKPIRLIERTLMSTPL